MITDDIEALVKFKAALKETFNAELDAASINAKPAEKTRIKHQLKSSPKFQTLNFFHKSLSEKNENKIISLFPELSFPRQWLDFLNFSDGLFYVSIHKKTKRGFAQSDFYLFGSRAYIDERQSYLNEICLEGRFPIEFRKVLIIGTVGTSDIGIWLHSDPTIDNEVIIFQPKAKNGYIPKHNFQILFNSVNDFIKHITNSIINDQPIDLCYKEGNDTFSFKHTENFPEKWVSKNKDRELELVTNFI